MAYLSVQQLDKYFGERALFTDLTFEVGEHDESYVRRKHNYYLKLAENAESNVI